MEISNDSKMVIGGALRMAICQVDAAYELAYIGWNKDAMTACTELRRKLEKAVEEMAE